MKTEVDRELGKVTDFEVAYVKAYEQCGRVPEFKVINPKQLSVGMMGVPMFDKAIVIEEVIDNRNMIVNGLWVEGFNANVQVDGKRFSRFDEPVAIIGTKERPRTTIESETRVDGDKISTTGDIARSRRVYHLVKIDRLKVENAVNKFLALKVMEFDARNYRTWTVKGVEVRAKPIKWDGRQHLQRYDDGKTIIAARDDLNNEDQEWLRIDCHEWLIKASPGARENRLQAKFINIDEKTNVVTLRPFDGKDIQVAYELLNRDNDHPFVSHVLGRREREKQQRADEEKRRQAQEKKAKAAPATADRYLKEARVFLEMGKKEAAKRRLQKVVDEFPNTDAAKEAKGLLQDLE